MLGKVKLAFGALAILLVVGCRRSEQLPELTLEDHGGKVLKSREDVMAQFRSAVWLEAKHGENQFMFCANDLPSYGNSKIDVHGWIFRDYSEQWESVLMVRLTGVLNVTLSVDPKTGLFSAKGSANNKFMNQVLCTFDVTAAE
jgi:hypothetical protein